MNYIIYIYIYYAQAAAATTPDASQFVRIETDLSYGGVYGTEAVSIQCETGFRSATNSRGPNRVLIGVHTRRSRNRSY